MLSTTIPHLPKHSTTLEERRLTHLWSERVLPKNPHNFVDAASIAHYSEQRILQSA